MLVNGCTTRLLTDADGQSSLGFPAHTPRLSISTTRSPPPLPKDSEKKSDSERKADTGSSKQPGPPPAAWVITWHLCLFEQALISLNNSVSDLTLPKGSCDITEWQYCFLRVLTPVITSYKFIGRLWVTLQASEIPSFSPCRRAHLVHLACSCTLHIVWFAKTSPVYPGTH